MARVARMNSINIFFKFIKIALVELSILGLSSVMGNGRSQKLNMLPSTQPSSSISSWSNISSAPFSCFRGHLLVIFVSVEVDFHQQMYIFQECVESAHQLCYMTVNFTG